LKYALKRLRTAFIISVTLTRPPGRRISLACSGTGATAWSALKATTVFRKPTRASTMFRSCSICLSVRKVMSITSWL
jgi:hypothetical protein